MVDKKLEDDPLYRLGKAKLEDDPSYRLGQAISILEGILGMKEDPTLEGIRKRIWIASGKKFILKERARVAQPMKELAQAMKEGS